MNLISRDTDYAIRALLFISMQRDKIISTAELENEIKLPRPFTRKIFQKLTKGGILKSIKGNKGGFALNKKPEEIFLQDIILLFQGKVEFSSCLFKKKVCPSTKSCALRKEIKEIEEYAIRKLKNISLEYLIKAF